MMSSTTPDEMTVPADSTAPVQSPTPGGFVMLVHGGQHDGRLIHVHADKCTIGRARDCTVCLSSPEFAPLHCLIVRGRGGVVARCWNEGATKLNGQDFTVSWMSPGDRLGVGPIELELLEGPSCWQPADPLSFERPAPSHAAHQDGELNERSSTSMPVVDELAKSRQLLDQLLEERQELLERLGSLELELQQSMEEHEHLRAVVDELREELASAMEQRREWQHERDGLQGPAEAARDRGEDDEAESLGRSVTDFDPPETVDDMEEARAVFPPAEVVDEDKEALDIKAVLARYGVVIREDDGESFAAQESSVSGKSASYGPRDVGGGTQPSASNAARSDAPAAADPPKPAKKRSTPIPGVNLSALRDVANLTARVNIDRAVRRQRLQQAGFKWSMGVSAVAIGWFVTVILPYDPVLAHVLSFTCWAMAIWWLFLGSIFYHKAVRSRPKPESRQGPEAAVNNDKKS